MSSELDWPEIEGPDAYEAVGSGPEVELKIKASRFIGQVFAVRDEPAARAAVESVRKRHHDARHHCWAFRLGAGDAARGLSDDDGEPGGSAGPPILQVIEGAEVSDLVVVVTRWFGGVKLGVGGLVRAYGDTAKEALGAAPRVTVDRDLRFPVGVDWADVGAVEAVLSRAGADVTGVDRNFGDLPEFLVTARRGRARALAEALLEGTAARARIGSPEENSEDS